MIRKVRVTQRQRTWITKRFAKKNTKLAKSADRMTHERFLKSIGLGPGEVKRYSTILFGSKGSTRNCEWNVLEKCLSWVDASYEDFVAADKQLPNIVKSGQENSSQNEDADFFLLAEKSLGDAISKDDKERLDETLHLIDAVIFTQPCFSVGQVKSIIFSIGELLHICRDRPIPSVSASQEGYGYGWYRLWLWMKRIVSVLRKMADNQSRDAETGTKLGLFIPWCEIMGVKMLRHKLFMKGVQKAPPLLLAEIRTTIRHSFLQSLCDGAEYYLSLCSRGCKQNLDIINKLKEIRRQVPRMDENRCRENALDVLEMIRPSLENNGLMRIKNFARSNQQEATDVIQSRIVLALITENWGRYLCYSSDSGDKKLLESLIASAEIAAWSGEVASICSDIWSETGNANSLDILNIPVEREFVVRLLSIVSDILFLRARQMDSWKYCDKRLDIRKTLQSAYVVGKVLKDYIDGGAKKFDRANIANNKVYGDLARKAGYYARYWFDNQEYFERNRKIGWLSFFEDEGKDEADECAYMDECALGMVRSLYDNLHLCLPWCQSASLKKVDELLDKMYWDFEMELWLEYDMRLLSFERYGKNSVWGANRDKTGGAKAGHEAPFNAFAEMVLLYSEMVWPGISSTDNSVRALIACRKWAAKQLKCAYYEPRNTKMNPAELLKLAMGTFLRFQNDPNGKREKYTYQNRGEKTSFVGWAKSILSKDDSSLSQNDGVEALRTFIEVVVSDFIHLIKFIEKNSGGNKEWFYLKKILRRTGEVPYPWNCEEGVRRCVDKLGCSIQQTLEPKTDGEQIRADAIDIEDITASGYDRLFSWIKRWRLDLSQEQDIASALGVSPQCISNLKSVRFKKVGIPKRKFIVEQASDILGVECSEILEEISDRRIDNRESAVFDNLDYDTADSDKKLERFVRALRNTSAGKKQYGFLENMAFYEKGLKQYFSNLKESGAGTKRKTYRLYSEWHDAKYDSMKILLEIKDKLKSHEDFYGMPVDRWFSHTHFLGVGDAVNILKLGFVGLEFLVANPDRKIGHEALRDIVVRCGDQLASAKPDWDGTKVLNDAIFHRRLR